MSADLLDKLSCLFDISINEIIGTQICKSNLAIAFRANELTAEDLEAICNINRIALNYEFMANLLKE